MKTDCTIKFNSIEEYREIEKTLEELGYIGDKDWDKYELSRYTKGYVCINNDFIVGNTKILFCVFESSEPFKIHYSSLKHFLND